MKNIIKVSSFLNTNPPVFDKLVSEIFNQLCFLTKDYPNFAYWYYNKVFPELNTEQREILCYIYRDKIAGVAILKNSILEKKICNIRVFPEFQKRGIGKLLFEQSFDILNTSKPIITVSEPRVQEFSSILMYYGFYLNEISNGIYVPKQKEFVFNGSLPKDQQSQYSEHLFV